MGNGKENDKEREREREGKKERESSVKRKYSSTVSREQLLYNTMFHKP